MGRQYRAFLLRCWQFGDERRFEVSHVQSGDTTRAATLAEAVAWIDTRLADRTAGDVPLNGGAPGDDPTAPPGRG